MSWLLLLAACATGPTADSADPADSADTADTAPDTADTSDTAVGDTADTDTAPDGWTVDADGDGYTPAEGDCDDALPHVHPGAPDHCDGLDQDCDGEPIPDHSCGETWPVEEMWSWTIEWDVYMTRAPHTGNISGDGTPEIVLRGVADDDLVYVMTIPEAGLPTRTVLSGATWTDDSPTWGMSTDLQPDDSTGDGFDDVWVLTEWRGSGPFGGLFLLPGAPEPIPLDDVRLDLAASAYWLDGDGVTLPVDGDPRGGVGDVTGDGLADVVLLTVGSGETPQVTYIAGDPDLAGVHTFGSLPQMVVGEDEITASAYLVGDLDGDGMDEVQFEHIEDLCYLSGSDWADGQRVGDVCARLSAGGGSDDAYVSSHSRNEAPGGDVEGDGLLDLLVHGRDATGAPSLRLLSGGIPSGDVAAWTTVQVLDVSAIGWTSDLDGDGVADPLTNTGAAASSALRAGGVFEVDDLRLVKSWSPDFTLSTTGDLDGDGLADWLMEDAYYSADDMTYIIRGFDIPWDDATKW